MGESSACLVRSFSHPSSTTSEYQEGDTLRALTASVSFGRFMTEPLAWEKWSSFTQNRYLEEVEKYSKPGSVAQKKAYFEAHYKRIAAKKAALLLEEDDEAANDSSEPSVEASVTDEICNDSSIDLEVEKSNRHTAIDEMQGQEAPRSELVFSIDANGCNPNVERNEFDTAQVEGAKPVIEQLDFIENPIQVELSNQQENVNHSKTMSTREEKTPIKTKNAANQGNLGSSNTKKPASSSSKSSYSGVSKLRAPVKVTTPVHPRKEDSDTPNCKKTARDSMEKKRSTTKSLHLSINFASRAGETIKASSPILQKIGNSRIIKTFVKASKDSWTQRTSTRASVNGVLKHTSVNPQPENRRSRTLLDRPVPGSRIVHGKSRSPSMEHSESSSACGRKTRSPLVSSSFSFRSEERAAKRKEFFQKLEEKHNNKEAEKVQLQAISKIPPTQPRSLKIGRKPTLSIIQDASSRPPWRSSLKTDGSKHVTEKNKRPPTHSVNSLPNKNMRENSSPNIPV